MTKFDRKRLYISIAVSLILLFISFSSIFTICRNSVTKISLLRLQSSESSRTLSVFEGLAKRLTRDKNSASEDNPVKKDDQKRSVLNLIYCLLGSVLITFDKSFLLLLISFVGVILGAGKLSAKDGCSDSVLFARIRFYLWWSLRFLTPLDKCMHNRSDEFDINPLMTVAGYVYTHRRPAL